MSGVRARVANRLRSSSLSAVPPLRQSAEYSQDMARAAVSILYRSPIPSREGRPVFVLNAAAMPDTHETDFDALLPYVLARLPDEDDLLKGFEYEVVFFAGDGDTTTTSRKHRPGWGWFLQAYHVLSRAMRKRLQKLYIVHEKAWVRILTEIFSTIVSPKFRRKTYHASSLTNLAQHIQLENLLIPSSTYLTDRRISDDIFVQHATGRRAFGARTPFPTGSSGRTRFPRVLREATSFVLIEENIVSEGLFRVPPHSKLRDVLKEAYDRGQKYIVWKDNGATLPVPPYTNAELQDEIIAEVDPKDAYSVFMAAALIKAWYASLRQPIFPTSAYPDMRRLYGDPHDIPDLDRLRDLFSPSSEWSPLPGISRDIIVRHLLPLLHAVSSRHDHNKMTAENLAVCFAPALLCGPDQIEDAKMSSIIRRVFTHAVEMWQHGLREACAQAPEAFEEELKLPKDDADWDDPIEKERNSGDGASFDEQISGITLEDNEEGHESYTKPYPELSHEDMPPPPPPRSRVSSSHSGDSTKRKPAPPLQVPPRYSTIISDSPGDVAESPATYAAITDGFAPRREDDSRDPPLPPRWTSVSDEKSGTRNPTSTTAPGSVVPNALPDISPISSFTAKPNIPKRKTLTQQQVYNAERSGVAPIPAQPAWKTYGSETRNFSQPQSAMPLPGLTELPQLKIGDEMGSIPVPTRAPPPVPSTQSEVTCPVLISPGTVDVHPASATEFRRSSIPASTNRTPIISLARPVYPPTKTPFHPVTDRPISKSTSLPGSIPKPRTVSAGLLHRMPSLETQKQDETASVRNRMLAPKKLNLRKQSVEDLRKLYEERAGTASALIEAGRRNKHDETHVRWT